MPAIAAPMQAYSSGAARTATMPPLAASTAPFTNTANSASDAPDTAASSTAAIAPSGQSRAPNRHKPTNGPAIAATNSHVCSGAREYPATGLPTVTTTASAVANIAAQLQSHLVTGAPVIRA